jgi:hypothetical protein
MLISLIAKQIKDFSQTDSWKEHAHIAATNKQEGTNVTLVAEF